MTTRRLALMRHGKSSWKEPYASDHARPLKERGRGDSRAMARRIAESDWIPDRIISSDATRAISTCELVCGEWDDAPPIDVDSVIYSGGLRGLFTRLEQVAAEVETLLVFGHNPTFEMAVAALSGDSILLKTANVALLTCEADSWAAAIEDPDWVCEDVLRPRDLDHIDEPFTRR